jgi:pyridinium-3,5-biscarboxylic acid mononucleotide synthase
MTADVSTLLRLIEALRAGTMSAEDFLAASAVPAKSYLPIDGIARIDTDRAARTGVSEFIYAPGKTAEQIRLIVGGFVSAHAKNILVTRIDDATATTVMDEFPDAAYHPLARILVVRPADLPRVGCIGIVSAGTADIPVAEEVEIACRALGSDTQRITDVGVAGLARTLDAIPQLQTARVVVCVAGMEASLPVVLAGLLRSPIIAVPTSVGYGVNAGGWNALLSILGSCAPGLLAVNIDNGIGAAAAAHRINLLGERIP